MLKAILLIAHGSRRAEANADLVIVAERLAAQLENDELIEIAYLELAEPSIPAGLERCVSRGASSIRMLPYFLSAGSHVAQDLERYREEFQQRYPETDCRVCPPIGLHPLMTEILLARLQEG
ncbi:sirohydrochlorin chelatase [Planctomicrobium sp. SH668]|uniref:sirohydrochlorin chelatase n=1 Tax=Planctomicrobium sp. SH668 TaxID=3448126 RepID=UPI003F5C5859